MSDVQAKSLVGLNGAATLQQLMHCANVANYELVANPGNLGISILANMPKPWIDDFFL